MKKIENQKTAIVQFKLSKNGTKISPFGQTEVNDSLEEEIRIVFILQLPYLDKAIEIIKTTPFQMFFFRQK